MIVKQVGKIITGAQLTEKERKALEIEIKKAIAEHDKAHCNELDAMILWILHTEFGFGEKRLRKFHDIFAPALDELVARYEMDDSDMAWLCTRKLKDAGIDIEEWNKDDA